MHVVAGELACRPWLGKCTIQQAGQSCAVCSVMPAEAAPDSVLPTGLRTIEGLPLPVWGPDGEEGGKAVLSVL